MRLARNLAALVLAWASGGCTTIAVSVAGEQPTTEHVFERAIVLDLTCITAPWSLVEGFTDYDALYGMAVVFAYGIVDLPFTYAAYSLHRAQSGR